MFGGMLLLTMDPLEVFGCAEVLVGSLNYKARGGRKKPIVRN